MPRSLLVLTTLLAIPSLVALAAAQDAGLAEVQAALDDVEKRIEAMPPGDVATANGIIKSLNETVGKLNKLKGKTDPAQYNEQAIRANGLAKKVQEKARQNPDGPPAPPPSAPPAGTPPAQTQKLSAVQKRQLGQMAESLAAHGRMLEKEDPANLKDEAQRAKWRAHAASFRQALERVGGEANPELKDYYDRIAAYEKILEDRIAIAEGRAPASAGPKPRTAPLSSGEKYELKKLTDKLEATERTVNQLDPQTVARPENEKEFRGVVAWYKKQLEVFGPADDLELAPYYEKATALEKLIDAKLAAGRAAVEAKRNAIAGEVAAKLAEIEALGPKELASDAVANPYRGAAQGWRTRLRELEPAAGAAALAPDIERVAAFEKRLAERTAEAKRLVAEKEAKEAGDVDAIVARLDSSFDRETFSAKLDPPYTEDRVREWVKNLKQWEETKEKGFALLDKIAKEYPRFEKDPRVMKLRGWFRDVLPRKLEEGIGSLATSWHPSSNTTAMGEWPGKLESCKWVLDPKNHTEARLSSDEFADKLKREAAAAIEAGEALAVFHKEYFGKEDPEIQKKIDAYKEVLVKVEGGAEAALRNARLPPARSNDPAMIEAAKAGLARGKFGPYERLVITSERPNRRKYVEWQGSTLYAYDFDEFSGATVENVDGDYRIVFYTWKFFRSGSSVTPLNVWVCASRHVGQRILKENIHK